MRTFCLSFYIKMKKDLLIKNIGPIDAGIGPIDAGLGPIDAGVGPNDAFLFGPIDAVFIWT